MPQKLLGFLTLIFTPILFAEKVDPTTYPDVKETPPPVVTLRSLNTGEPIRNSHYGERSELNTHWVLTDVLLNHRHYVQFKAVGTEKCMTIGTSVEDCNELNDTTFDLIPTDTGAFILSSSRDGICLLSRNFREYDLAQCIRPEQRDRPVPLEFLWTISPPFGQSQVLKAPTK